MGLNYYNVGRDGRIGIRDVTWYDFEQWSRRVARADRDLDDALPELVGLVVKEIDGKPWTATTIGDVPPVSAKGMNTLQRLIGDEISISDEEREAARESVVAVGNERTARVVGLDNQVRAVRYRCPTLDEYQRARRTAKGAGVWLLDLMVSCLIDVDGKAPIGGVIPLTLHEGLIYRALIADEVSPDEDEIAEIKASRTRVEG